MSDSVLLAEKLAGRGEIDEAIKVLLAELARDNPQSRQIAIHAMLGDLYSTKLEIDSAVTQYDAIIKIMPQSELAHFRKGLALKRCATRESFEAAIAEFRESYRLGHVGSESLSNIGFCYKMLADFDLVVETQRENCLKEATESFLRSLQMDPQNDHALFHLADLEFNAGHFEDAQEMYRKLSELRPHDPSPLVRMANAMRNSGDPGGALTPLQQALELILARKKSTGWEQDPAFRGTEVDCHLYRAEALMALSRTQEARKEYEAVLDLTTPRTEEWSTIKMRSCRERALEMLRDDSTSEDDMTRGRREANALREAIDALRAGRAEDYYASLPTDREREAADKLGKLGYGIAPLEMSGCGPTFVMAKDRERLGWVELMPDGQWRAKKEGFMGPEFSDPGDIYETGPLAALCALAGHPLGP